jgi:hypothetical protein
MWRRRRDILEAWGTVLAIEEHTIPNKARGKPPRVETRLQIDVTDVLDGRGRPLTGVRDRDFRYYGRLGPRFKVGDSVKVSYAAGTGGTIKAISAAKPR